MKMALLCASVTMRLRRHRVRRTAHDRRHIAEPGQAMTRNRTTLRYAAKGFGTLRTRGAPSVAACPTQQDDSLATGLGSVNVTHLVTSY